MSIPLPVTSSMPANLAYFCSQGSSQILHPVFSAHTACYCMPELSLTGHTSTATYDSMLQTMISSACVSTTSIMEENPALCSPAETTTYASLSDAIVQHLDIKIRGTCAKLHQQSSLGLQLPAPAAKAGMLLQLDAPHMQQAPQLSKVLAVASLHPHCQPDTDLLSPLSAICMGRTWLDLLMPDLILQDSPQLLPWVSMPDAAHAKLSYLPATAALKPLSMSHLELHVSWSFLGRGPELKTILEDVKGWCIPQHLPQLESALSSMYMHNLDGRNMQRLPCPSPLPLLPLRSAFRLPASQTGLASKPDAPGSKAEQQAAKIRPASTPAKRSGIFRHASPTGKPKKQVVSAGLGFYMNMQQRMDSQPSPSSCPSSDDERCIQAPELQCDTITLPARHIAILDALKAEQDGILAASCGVDARLLDPSTDWMSSAAINSALHSVMERDRLMPGSQTQLRRTYAALAVIRQTATTLHLYGIR